MKKITTILALVLAIATLSILAVPALAASATDDAAGIIVCATSGTKYCWNAAYVTICDVDIVITAPLNNSDFSSEFLTQSGNSTELSYIGAFDGFSAYAPTASVSASPMESANWDGSDNLYVFYTTDGSSFQSMQVAVLSEDNANGNLTLSGVPTGAYPGAAIVNEDGKYVGCLYRSESGNSSPLCLSTAYLESNLESTIASLTDSSNEGEDSSDSSAVTVGLVSILFVLVAGGLVVLIFRSKSKSNGGDAMLSEEPIPTPEGSTPRRICIIGEGGLFNGRKFEIDGSVMIGRQKQRCNICYPTDAKGVSGLHCQLRRTGTNIELIDLGSSFGTFVNGTRIQPNAPVLLKPGDRFYLANEKNTFVVY